MRTLIRLLVAAALPLTAAQAQDQASWRWSGTLGEGHTFYLYNVNGSVRIETGSGNTVEVRAEKRWRRGDPEDVRIEARMAGSGNGDVVVCALWDPRATCDEAGIRGSSGRNRNWRSNDVSVEFTVRVPAHARVVTESVNGDVTVSEVAGDVRAETTNGDIEARSTRGRVQANTVNGSITVAGTLNREGVEYETVNGSITIELPAGVNADVDLSTVNGRIATDFPITFDGTVNPRHIRAEIGEGGARLRARTVNGSIRLRRQ